MKSKKACQLCKALTVKGVSCKRCASAGSHYCVIHGAPKKTSSQKHVASSTSKHPLKYTKKTSSPLKKTSPPPKKTSPHVKKTVTTPTTTYHKQSVPVWTVVTYNLSWATAMHKEVGSEARFVRDMCPYDGHCRGNAIESLRRMPYSADLYGFQEYRPWIYRHNDPIATTMGPFVLSPVHADHVIAPDNVTLASLFRPSANVVGYITGVQLSFYQALLTCWDTRVFGNVVNLRSKNVVQSQHEARPCFVAYTSKRVLIVNVHAPQPDTQDLHTVFQFIDRTCHEVVGSRPTPLHIVITGDFNDSPEALTFVPSVMGLNVRPPAMIRTCCYDPGYGMQQGSYQFPGDYVLSDLQTVSTYNIRPDGTLSTEDVTKPTVGRSDHDPIVVTFRTK